MARNSAYEVQLTETCRLIAEGLSHPDWKLVYQSRSGSPGQPWLEPDIGDYLRTLKNDGMEDVVIAPVGFISDHMEVLYDLDTEAKQLADEIGLNIVRAATVGTHPEFVSMIRELIVERLTNSQDVCATNCCLPASPGLAVAQSEEVKQS
jgi:ferrochelatase